MVAVRHVKPRPPRMTKTEQLQKFLDHWLIGPEANKSFEQAGQIPLDFKSNPIMSNPIMGFNNPVGGLNNITQAGIAKAGLIAKGVGNTSLADFFGAKDIAKIFNSKASTADIIKSLSSLGLMYGPLKTPKGVVKSMMKPILTLMNQLNPMG